MTTGVTFQKINEEESWKVFDRAARRTLGMSGEEFLRRWDAGEYKNEQRAELMEVLMLRPSGR